MSADGAGIGPYFCMPHPVLVDGRWAVQAVEPFHIEAIRTWRNAQIEVLRQAVKIGPAEQVKYYTDHVWPEKARTHPSNVLLIYLQDTVPIGYGGLVHIAWEHRRAEVSFLLDLKFETDEDARADLFLRFLALMQRLAFDDLGLERLFTETYATRSRHVRTLEDAGFVREGSLRGHVQIDGVAVDSVIHGSLKSERGGNRK